MKNKFINILILSLICSSNLIFATSFANSYNPLQTTTTSINRPMDSFYANPANLVNDDKLNFEIGANLYSDIDMVKYLFNPSNYYTKAISNIKNFVTDSSFDAKEFWNNSKDLINELKTNDSNFPNVNSENLTDFEIFEVNQYFKNLNPETFPVSNSSYMFLAFKENSNLIENNPQIQRDQRLALNLNFAKGTIKDGVGYKFLLNSTFITADSNNTELGALAVSLTAPVGYAFTCYDNYDFGFDIRPSINFIAEFSDADFYRSRNSSSLIPLFINPMQFGYGLGVDFGMNYHLREDLYFSAVLRNLPSAQQYWTIDPTDLINFNMSKFQKNEIINFQNADLALAFNHINRKNGKRNYEVNGELHNFVSKIKNNNFSNFEDMFTLNVKVYLTNLSYLNFKYDDKNIYLQIYNKNEIGNSLFSLKLRVLDFSRGCSLGISSKLSF